MTRSTLLALSIAALTACSDKGSGGGKPTWQKVGPLPVEAELPAGAVIRDNSQMMARPMVAVFGPRDSNDLAGPRIMSVGDPLYGATLEDAKSRFPGKPTTFTREETTADGFILEDAANILVRRTIDGRPYDCSITDAQQAEREQALKACQSLRAAK
jgi:hypothetical protein